MQNGSTPVAFRAVSKKEKLCGIRRKTFFVVKLRSVSGLFVLLEMWNFKVTQFFQRAHFLKHRVLIMLHRYNEDE